MEDPKEYINDVLLKDVETKWLMSNFRKKGEMNCFCDGYMFGVHDIDYSKGRILSNHNLI